MPIVPKRFEMPVQAPEIRGHNFGEVALGYDETLAVSEAQRCLSCKNQPCVSACPVNVHIPDFIHCVKEGRFEDAYSVIWRSKFYKHKKIKPARLYLFGVVDGNITVF